MILAHSGHVPQLADDVYVSDNATIIGDVVLGARASVWFGAVLRADVEKIRIGAGSNIQDLSVVLADGSGNRAVVHASSVDDRALTYPVSDRYGGHFILDQVRFPLSRFSGVHLGDVTDVGLRFNRTRSGVIDVSDLAFVR